MPSIETVNPKPAIKEKVGFENLNLKFFNFVFVAFCISNFQDQNCGRVELVHLLFVSELKFKTSKNKYIPILFIMAIDEFSTVANF